MAKERMVEMKAISLWQPHASLMAVELKLIETQELPERVIEYA